jgi:hypothetical protein
VGGAPQIFKAGIDMQWTLLKVVQVLGSSGLVTSP